MLFYVKPDKTYLQESKMIFFKNSSIYMISRFFPSQFIHTHTDDCCPVPMEREVTIAGQAAKGTITVRFIFNKTANIFCKLYI